MSPNGAKLCVAGTMSRYAAIVTRKPLKLKPTIPVGRDPYWSHSSENGKYCFVSVAGEDRVSVISFKTAREVGEPQGRRPSAADAHRGDPTRLGATGALRAHSASGGWPDSPASRSKGAAEATQSGHALRHAAIVSRTSSVRQGTFTAVRRR